MNLSLCLFEFGLGFNSSMPFGNKLFNILDVTVGHRRRIGMVEEVRTCSASRHLLWRGWVRLSPAITAIKHQIH